MSISTVNEDNGKLLKIVVDGRFDFSQLQSFRCAYEQIEKKPQGYIIDLSASNYIDSSALGMLLALRDHAGGDSADITIKNCSPDIKKILMITKLDELFKIE